MMGRASTVLQVTRGMNCSRTPASTSVQAVKIAILLCSCVLGESRTLDPRLRMCTVVCLLNLGISILPVVRDRKTQLTLSGVNGLYWFRSWESAW